MLFTLTARMLTFYTCENIHFVPALLYVFIVKQDPVILLKVSMASALGRHYLVLERYKLSCVAFVVSLVLLLNPPSLPL